MPRKGVSVSVCGGRGVGGGGAGILAEEDRDTVSSDGYSSTIIPYRSTMHGAITV